MLCLTHNVLHTGVFASGVMPNCAASFGDYPGDYHQDIQDILQWAVWVS